MNTHNPVLYKPTLRKILGLSLAGLFVLSACQSVQSPAGGTVPPTDPTETPAAEEAAMPEVEEGGGQVVAEGLNGPMGIAVADDGAIWVIDSGVGGEETMPFVNPQTGESMDAMFGETARVVQIATDGTQTDVAHLPSVNTGMDVIGGARLTMIGDTLYATVGQWMGDPASERPPLMGAIVEIADGGVTEVADTWAWEASENPDGHIYDSHPYGLAASADGSLIVTDAAGNSLLRVDPATGAIETLAVFEGIPGMPFPNEARGGAMESDPVPTGVTLGDEGNIFVSLLPGFPFAPGSARVLKVAPDGTVSDYATGLTTLTDVRMGPDGNLYAVQFAVFGEQGPAPDSGAIIRIVEGAESTPLVEGLSFPTSLAFDASGNAYVTINGVGAPGSGQVVMFPELTAMQ
jgi:sugar lactone lactonase YvrE